MSCERCGWEGDDPHPKSGCPSDFRVGDEVYVEFDPDRAPLPAKFARIVFFTPEVMVGVVDTDDREHIVNYAYLTAIEKWPVLCE